MRKAFYVVLGAVLLPVALVGCSSGQMASSGDSMAAAPASSFDQTVSPILSTYCVGCHSGENPRAGVRLSFENEEAARQDEALWARVAAAVGEGRMPPQFANQKPTDAERAALVEWANGVN